MRLILPEQIRTKIEKMCPLPKNRDYFHTKDLVDPLCAFIDDDLKSFDNILFKHYENFRGTDERTLRYAWGDLGKKDDGALKDLRDLLCYFAFKLNWTDTLKKLKINEDELIAATNKCKENYLLSLKANLHSNEKVGITDEKTFLYDEESIHSLSKELQELYEADNIVEGLNLVENVIKKHTSHPDILKHFFRFNMRIKNWEGIRDKVAKLSELQAKNEKILAICMLILFECEIRECYVVYRYDKIEFSKEVRKARKYLAQIPSSFHNDNFYYWTGKWHLDLWWCTDDKTNLLNALSFFNLSLEIQYRWWVHCYKCIVLKILGHNNFEEECQTLKNNIFIIRKKKKKQASLKSFWVTTLILLEEIDELKEFIKKIKPSSMSEFPVTVLHHVDMIFHDDPQKHNIYCQIVNDWITSQ